jgi:hypothetical protein
MEAGMRNNRLVFLAFFAAGLILSSCGPTQQELELTATEIAKTFIAEQKQTPSVTPPPTITPRPTLTPYPSATPEPITYSVGNCMSIEKPASNSIPFKYEMRECVESVSILWDGSMRVNFLWEYTRLSEGELAEGECIVKGPDYLNKNMYMKDDLGNRYDHIDGGEYMGRPVLCEGTGFGSKSNDDYGTISSFFLFPAVDPNSGYLIFYDDDQGIQTSPFAIGW